MDLQKTKDKILPVMALVVTFSLACVSWLVLAAPRVAQTSGSDPYTEPRWISKAKALDHSEKLLAAGSGIQVGKNIDVSSRSGPQSECFITLSVLNPQRLVAGSNEISRATMGGYFSADGGSSWRISDPPLSDGTNTVYRFASDPGLASDTLGNFFYSYILVGFRNFKPNAVVVARSTDGGTTWPHVAVGDRLTDGGLGTFIDKPLVTADNNFSSPFRDNVYLAWDTAFGFGEGKVFLARSVDHGVTLEPPVRIDDPESGSGINEIGVSPAVGPDGEVYCAWNDIRHNTIAVDRSLDGAVTFGRDRIIASKTIPFDTGIPAIAVRRALIYPSLDVDRGGSANRGKVYCAWTDQAGPGAFVDGAETDIFFARSTDRGLTWSSRVRVNDDAAGNDQFYQWLSVDPTDGSINVMWQDTRNDPQRRKVDIFFARSTDGGLTFSKNVRVTTAPTDESCPVCEQCIAESGFNACAIFCRQNCDAEIFNQYGDYNGLVSFGGLSFPVWTDRRTGERLNEEVFTAVIKAR